MADCECLNGCLFFNNKMAGRPITTGVYKRRFCLDDNSNCARYMVFKVKGRDAVPDDLYPNEQERAKKQLNTA